MRLADKVAIVTGAARGIGFAIAERFVSEGARVVLADIDGEAGEAAAETLAARGQATFVTCDVGDKLSVKKLTSAAREAYTGGVDILVNNAAAVMAADFLDLREEDFDRVLRTNLKGPFLLSQCVARTMIEQIKGGGKPGSIINISSINAVVAIANQVAYAASKGGLNQLTKVLAINLAPWGIRVNGVGPGSIRTEMLADSIAAAGKDAEQRILSRTPLGRFGEPAEIAAIAAFLASDEASYVTGQTLYADGGRLGLNYTMPPQARS